MSIHVAETKKILKSKSPKYSNTDKKEKQKQKQNTQGKDHHNSLHITYSL